MKKKAKKATAGEKIADDFASGGDWGQQQRRDIALSLDAARPSLDTDRLLAWWHESPRRDPATAFTSGPERAAADLMEIAARPAKGWVKLDDGREVKVLGTLPMTEDECVVGLGAQLFSLLPNRSGSYDIGLEQVMITDWDQWDDDDAIARQVASVRSKFSTREAAIASREEAAGIKSSDGTHDATGATNGTKH